MVTQSSLSHNNGARSPSFSFSPGKNNSAKVKFAATPTFKITAPTFRTTPYPTVVGTPTSNKLFRYGAKNTNGNHGAIDSTATNGSVSNTMACPPPDKRASLFSPPPNWPKDTSNHKAAIFGSFKETVCPPPAKRAPLFSPQPNCSNDTNNHKASVFGSSNTTATATARGRNPSHTDWRTSLAGSTPFSIDNYLQNSPSPYPESDIKTVGVKEGPPTGSRPTRPYAFSFGSNRTSISKDVSVNNTGKSGQTGTVRQVQKEKSGLNLCPEFAFAADNTIMTNATAAAPPAVANNPIVMTKAANTTASTSASVKTSATVFDDNLGVHGKVVGTHTTAASTSASAKTGSQVAVFDYDLGLHGRIPKAQTTAASISTSTQTGTYGAIFDEDLDVDGKVAVAPSSAASTSAPAKTSTYVAASDDVLDLDRKVAKTPSTKSSAPTSANQTGDLETRVKVLEERMVAFLGSPNEEEENCPPNTTPAKPSNKAKTPSKNPCNTPNPQSPRRTRSMSAKKKRSGRHSMTLRQLTPARA